MNVYGPSRLTDVRIRPNRVFASALLLAMPLFAQQRPPNLNGTYIATAYAQHGITASGEYVHRHVVAADPAILPIGTRLKIRHAGRYSGEYVVMDTGDKIEGRRLDIYLPSVRKCKKFGAKPVKVRVLELGDGTRQAAKQADQVVKQHVAQDVQKAVVGNSATQDDWAAKGAPVAAAIKAGSTTAPATTSSTTPASTTPAPKPKASNTATPGATTGNPN